MRRYFALTVGVAALFGSTASHASVTMSSVGYGFDTAKKNADKVLTFDGPNPAGISLSGGSIRNFSDGYGARPGTSPTTFDTSNYLAVNPGQDAKILSDKGYRAVSLYWGSIDWYNQVGLLDQAGKVFASFSGSDVTNPANGDQSLFSTNRDVTFTTNGTSSPIYGLLLQSTRPALEVDNVAFSGAVPEASTWLMMIAGMGVVGGAMRYRRQKGTSLVRSGA